MIKITTVFTDLSPVLFQIKRKNDLIHCHKYWFLKVLLISLDLTITRPILYAKKHAISTGIAMRAIRT